MGPLSGWSPGKNFPVVPPPPPPPWAALTSRGVPIIGSAKISADMVIFTNSVSGAGQQEDRYRYQFLYSSKSVHKRIISTLSMWLFSASGLLFTLKQGLRYEKPYKYT